MLPNYADPRTPPTLFTVATIDQIPVRASWRQLTDANPQARGFALGDEEEISWKSTDGKTVGGILIKPVGYHPGTRYPLIVAIHGGPASADVLGFNGGYGAQTYAGAGYAVLMPNYRGSTNYGEQHKTDIVGNYFQKGYEDIMTGVDHLISQGIVDSTKMGVLGWSAGGHWSNWILTHTNRFKAISTGAGTSNWISMYAESDVQRNRQFYLGNRLPYDDFDAYWNQSPLKYIKNASNTGLYPEFMKAENDMLAAEGYIRTGNIAAAAAKVDLSRVGNGSLPALTGAVTSATEAVPGCTS